MHGGEKILLGQTVPDDHFFHQFCHRFFTDFFKTFDFYKYFFFCFVSLPKSKLVDKDCGEHKYNTSSLYFDLFIQYIERSLIIKT